MVHDGDVYVAGRTKVLRFHPATSGWATEPMDYAGLDASEVQSQRWFGIGGQGDAFFVIGSRERIMRRGATGWAWEQNPEGVGEFRALAVISEQDMYLFHATVSASKRVRRYDGTSWSTLDVALPLPSPNVAWVQDATTFYVSGSSDGAPALFRATR